MTRRRLLAGLLTLIMVLQTLVPGAALAKSSKPLNDNLITIGKLTKKDYPQIDKDTALRVAREQKNKRKGFLGRGATLFSADSPYITGQQPGDADKPKYLANITGKVEAKGLDGGNFDWNKIFGDKPIKLELRQLDKTKLDKQTNPLGETGLILTLEVSKAGKFKLTDRAGNLTDLPLFSAEGNPFEYQIQVDRKSYENVELIISTNAGTPGSKFEQVGEKQIATLSFTIGIQQLASTKFTSEWHTGVAEADRPQIEGYFKVGEDLDNDFNFPKNDTTRTILRSGFLENFVEDEENGPWAFIDSELEAAPESVEVKTDTAGLTFKDNNGVKTVTSGDHKFKYDFTYDVINGGKLTMTEIIPVTFDANGGKFASITDPNAKQEIKKEVEYEKDVTAPEEPTKDRETFKGWGIKAPGSGTLTPVKDADYQSIKAAKTFYAIWESKAFTADGLTVHESYKEGNTYVNDFIPKLDELKVKVQVEGNGLTNEDKLAILDDSNNPLTEKAAVKEYLYTKLGEENDNKIDRTVEIKGRVTDAAGKTHDVMIPIKVIKNIYEAKTK
ncbi:MAG: InlB B-repeat-containing protein, partial [Peptoniphilaceae bacterium]